jgi:hypothetical protein
MKNPLHLITLYDATRHEYTLYRHNLTEEGANKAIRELAARLFGLVIRDQRSKHLIGNPEECLACRRVVEESTHVKPRPKFQRRNE